MFKNLLVTILLLTTVIPSGSLASKIQQTGIVGTADCAARGISNANCLPLTDQIYDSANGQQLSLSISGGLLGGSGGGAAVELLSNTGFESGTSGWTASGGTFVTITSTSNLIAGAKTADWIASASGQTLSSAAFAVKGLAGGQCSAQLYYIYGGSASDYKFQVIDGSANVLASMNLAVQALANTPVTLTFPCGSATTSTVQWQLKSSVASPGHIYFDTTHLGSMLVQSTIGVVTPWVTYPMTITGTTTNPTKATSPTIDFARWRRVNDTMEIQYDYQAPNATGAADGSGLYLFPLPSGYAADTTKITIPGTISNYPVIGFANHSNIKDYAATQSLGWPSMYDTTHMYLAGQLNSGVGSRCVVGGSATMFGAAQCAGSMSSASFTVSFHAKIPIAGWDASTIATATSVGQQPQSWSGYHKGACNFSTTTTGGSGAAADIGQSSASCDVTQLTNNNFGTVTTYGGAGTGAKSGIVFTPTQAGLYQVCANFLSNESVSGNGFYMKLTDGSGNSIGQAQNLASVANFYLPITMCGMLNATSVAAQTVKVQGAVDSGTGTIYTAGTQNAINWTIYALNNSLGVSQFTGPGSVISSSTLVARDEVVTFGGVTPWASLCTSSPCTVWSPNDITSTNHVVRTGTGQYSININPGLCSTISEVNAQCGSTTGSNWFTQWNGMNTWTSTLVKIYATDSSLSLTDAACTVRIRCKP